MENSSLIYQKLEDFIKKFYTNELLKGIILFTGLGLMYFIITLLVEHFYWLKPNGRLLLFYAFVGVELFLILRFILFPLFQLFKIKKGINYDDASRIIGSHFTEVNDKLTNFLQLSKENSQSELLLASIEQKAGLLQPIPFGNAINFSKNKKYLPFAVLPILIFLFFYISGNSKIITASLNRVVNYQEQFVPPAPFEFVILNDQLQTEQGNDFILKVKSQGNIVPENAMIYIGNESYYMESSSVGIFEYRIAKPVDNVRFNIQANKVSSPDYELKVVAVPTITNFEMQMQYPAYINKKGEIIKGTGNAIVPEGTIVTWKMTALATEKVEWSDFDNIKLFAIDENGFRLTQKIIQNTEYQIFTSNKSVKNYEKLNYQINVIKDQHPGINVSHAPDSLKIDQAIVIGQVSDDYGLSKLQIVYYPVGKPDDAKRGTIPVKHEVFDQFIFSFPGDLPIQEGITYEYFFEVFDNDALHNFKSTKSAVFASRVKTEQEKQDENLQQQNDNIQGLQKSLREQNKQLNALDQLQKSTRQKDNLEFKDQKKIEDFINRQKNQDEMMKEFTKKIQENIDKVKTDKNDEFKEELQKRLEKNAEDLEKNKKLLEELKELNQKLKEEELFEKVDKFKQTSKNQAKSLEQLLELTKRFYVEKKAEQIANKLDELGDKQEKLSDNNKENNTDNQDAINKEFDKIKEDLKDLDKENKSLKSPMEIPNDINEQKNIEEDLNKAKEELQKESKDKAKPKQKSAAKKMKSMAQKMVQEMAGGEMEQMEEDVAMLRQILDNLLAYSFSQEDLMKQFRGTKKGSPSFNINLKKQQDLRTQFQHVDDSLFALSLRNPKLDETITKEIGEVHYNIDKALDNLVEVMIPKGVSHQQYAVSASNKLADLLSDLLNSMQMSMSGMGTPKPGQGQGEMQLPDIIMKQSELGEKMKKAEKGKKDGEEKGEEPGKGQEGQQGKDGKKSGKDGKNQGEGKGSSEGEGGEDGEGNAGKIMEIYKEQRQLREALEKELNKKGLGGSGQNALDEMKQIEKQLLNQGITPQTMQRIFNLKHELLKLDTAVREQGEEERRQAQTNKKSFNNTTNELSPVLKEYLNSIEILNRQSLPLRTNFNQKVQDYFKK